MQQPLLTVGICMRVVPGIERREKERRIKVYHVYL